MIHFMNSLLNIFEEAFTVKIYLYGGQVIDRVSYGKIDLNAHCIDCDVAGQPASIRIGQIAAVVKEEN